MTIHSLKLLNWRRKYVARLVSGLLPLVGMLAFTGERTYAKPPERLPLRAIAQTGSACGPAGGHCTTIAWGASTSALACTSPCILEYNVFRGTTSGGESATPINTSLISGLTYTDPITLTSNPQTFYYYIEAVETSTPGGVTVSSAPSNEVSATFPGIPASPPSPSAVPH